MASESEADASFVERLIGSRNRDLSLLFPIIVGIMDPPRREEAHELADGPDQEPQAEGQERIVLINPFTQGMVIIDGGGRNFDALIRGLSEMDSGKSGPPPASKASIEAMPTVVVVEEGEECSICLEEIGVGDEAKEMPCKHRYHMDCIGTWLGLHGSCPVCRYKMPVEEEEAKKGEEGGNGRRGRRAEREIWVSFSVGRRDSSTPPDAAADTSTNSNEGE